MTYNIESTGKGSVRWSRQLADELDVKDGKKDGKISASVWNAFLDKMGSSGNKIKNYISVDNAVRSFEYYNTKKDKGVVDWSNWSANSGNDVKDTSEAQQKKSEKNPQEENVQEDTGVAVGNYDETKSKYKSIDGIIDKSAQGQSGDCWLLSGLNALSETKWGRSAIKNAIKYDEQTGNVTITLKGAYGKRKTFNVTKAEMEAAKSSDKYSHGDGDVLAFELAIEKYRKQFGQTLDGGFEEEVFRLITGSHNTQMLQNKASIKNLLAKAKANPDEYAIGASFNIEGEGFHAYNVSRFETDKFGNKYVILTNPWVGNREIKIQEQEFLRYVYQIEVLKNPTGVKHSYTNNSDGIIGNTKASSKNLDSNVAKAIYAVANSDPQIIKDSIKKGANGSIIVTLKGVNKTYTISAKELDKARDSGNYTNGDDDVIALEIAMEKYGKEKVNMQHPVDLATDPGFEGWAVIAGTNIYSISDSTAIYLLTGKENMYAVLNKDTKKLELSSTPPSFTSSFNPNAVRNIFDKISGNSNS